MTGVQTCALPILLNLSNSTWKSGGAVLIDPGARSMITTDCTYLNNFSERKGGAIDFDCHSASSADAVNFKLNITDCRFLDNVAKEEGGGVYVYTTSGSTDFQLSKSTFFNNTGNLGGAVYANGFDRWVRFTACSFISNLASGFEPPFDGGAVWFSGAIGELSV